MKKYILTIMLFSLGFAGYAQVGIGTASPTLTLEVVGANDNGAVTGVDGVLVPRVNDTDMSTATDGTVDGQMVYNTVAKKFYYWNATAWTEVGGGPDFTVVGITSGAYNDDFSGITNNVINITSSTVGPGTDLLSFPDATTNTGRQILIKNNGTKEFMPTGGMGQPVLATLTGAWVSDGTQWVKF